MGYERDTRGRYPGDYYGRDAAADYGAGREDYSGARDYQAAGMSGGGQRQGYGRQDYGDDRYEQRDRMSRPGAGQQRGWTSEERYGDFDRDRQGFSGGSDYRGEDRSRRVGVYGSGNAQRDYSRGPDRQERGGYGRSAQDQDDDRGFFARAGDEVRSWFGDEDAERRREADARHSDHETGRSSYGRDEHYHSWRDQQLASFDRDYHEYRQENQSKFHNEFASWRTERQGQRDLLNKVEEHAEVVGSDGEHVGTVDKVRGDRIILTKNDADAGGRHHSIPSRWLQSAEGNKVTLRKTAAEAKQHWRDEERQEQERHKGGSEDRSAMFGGRDDRQADQGSTAQHPTNLNRSFSGTY